MRLIMQTIEIEATADELRSSQTLGDAFLNVLRRAAIFTGAGAGYSGDGGECLDEEEEDLEGGKGAE